MAMDEEYLDNLLKNFEEEEKARETQIQKEIITDIVDNSVSEENQELKNIESEEAESEYEAVETLKSEEKDAEEWKTDLDELLADAVDKLDESDDTFEKNDLGELLSGYVSSEEKRKESISQENVMPEDADVTQYIDKWEMEDEGLKEINELLKKSDNNETVDILENVEKDELFDARGEDIQELVKETVPKKEKKRANPFGSFFSALLKEEKETDEDETLISSDDTLKGANADKAEEGKKKKEKKKKEKRKKEKEKKEKNKKEKKKKEKNKKVQKESEETVKGIPKKVLSRKSLSVMAAFCASIIAAIMSLSVFLPDYAEKKQAREAFYKGDYKETYILLYDKNLNANDMLIFNRVSTVLKMERITEAYYFYQEVGEEAKALDMLFAGIRKYGEITDKDEFGAGEELLNSYQKILSILMQQYSIDESEALEIIAYDDTRYSERIYSIVEGTAIPKSDEAKEDSDKPQDILPAEEDMAELNKGNEGA